MKSEKKVSHLEADIMKLKTQLADSELRFIGTTAKARSGALKLASDQLGEQSPAQLDVATVTKLVRKLGCNFQIFYSPFLEFKDFANPRPSFGAYDLERYSAPRNNLLGVTADLYECVPAKYYDLLLSPHSEVYSEKYIKMASCSC